PHREERYRTKQEQKSRAVRRCRTAASLCALPDMDRTLIEDHLAMAERHVQEAIRHVEQQQALIAALARDGHDTTAARVLLTQFQEVLQIDLADPARLRAEFAFAG